MRLTRRGLFRGFFGIAAAGTPVAIAAKSVLPPVLGEFEQFGVDWESDQFGNTTLPAARAGQYFMTGPRSEKARCIDESRYMDALESLVREQACGRRAHFMAGDLPGGVHESRHVKHRSLPVVRRVAMFDHVRGVLMVRNDVYVRFQ